MMFASFPQNRVINCEGNMPKKLSLYKSVKTERGWRYCKAAFHSNAKVKPNIVLVNDVEEKHAEGSYFTLSDNQWVALGDDALDAQRELMAMNAQREFQRLSQNPQQRESPVPAVSNGRKLICEEIERYLEGLVAAKRPAKSVRMNRNFLNAFADLAKKQYTDEYGRHGDLLLQLIRRKRAEQVAGAFYV